jgi:hypothetical protein
MTIEHLKTSDLIPYARNAKKHDASQVAKLAGSIREFGFTNPVLIDKDNGIIAGHGRVLAAQSLALETVPCIRLGHLTDTRRRAYILADNRLAEIGGGWDEEMLKLELADLAALDVDVAEIGFGAEDLAELEMEMEDEPEKSDADAEPQIDKADELRAKWGVEPGQLWELGEHRLLCGDSRQKKSTETLMGGVLLTWSLLTRLMVSPMSGKPKTRSRSRTTMWMKKHSLRCAKIGSTEPMKFRGLALIGLQRSRRDRCMGFSFSTGSNAASFGRSWCGTRIPWCSVTASITTSTSRFFLDGSLATD